MKTLEELAARIDKLMYDFNPYDYLDCYDEEGDGEPVVLELLALDPKTVMEKLREISESDDENAAKEAAEILEHMTEQEERSRKV